MTEALDKVLNAVDVKHRVYELARTWGATEECASAFADNKASQFKFDGVALTWNVNGKLAVDDAECREHFTQGPLKALFPTTASTLPDVDAAMLASAKSGNMTSYSRLVRQHSKATVDSLLAQKPAVADDSTKDGRSKDDTSNNPWKSPNFKTDKAALAEADRLTRTLGTEVARQLSRAAGKTLGGDPLRA
jgi:hypothetical protein